MSNNEVHGMSSQVEKIIKVYIKIRDKKDELTKQFKDATAELDVQLKKLEDQMLALSLETGVQSFKSEFGTCYKKRTEKASVADWPTLESWVLESGDLSLLEHRVKVTAVREYAEANEGRLPPGVNIFAEDKMYFNRPAK